MIHCSHENEVGVDIFLPPDLLFSTESLANFPIPVQSIANLSQYRHSLPPVSLTSFMVSIGIARMLLSLQPAGPLTPLQLSLSCPPLLTSTPWLPQAVTLPMGVMPMEFSLRPAITSTTISSSTILDQSNSSLQQPGAPASLQEIPYPPEAIPDAASSTESSYTGSTEDLECTPVPKGAREETSESQTVDTSPPLTVKDLKPLVIHLGSSKDFLLLVSHVVSPSQFYVYPVQQQSASDMVTLPDSLQQHYSDTAKSIPLPCDHVRTGNLCCLQFSADGLYCRGVIISVRDCEDTSDDLPKPERECHVLSIDYGDSNWVKASALSILDVKFCKFPVQCVSCMLCGIRPSSSEGEASQKVLPESRRANKLQDSGIESPPPDTSMSGVKPSSMPAAQVVPSSSSLPEWSDKANELFRELTDGKQLVAIVRNEGEPVMSRCKLMKKLPQSCSYWRKHVGREGG